MATRTTKKSPSVSSVSTAKTQKVSKVSENTDVKSNTPIASQSKKPVKRVAVKLDDSVLINVKSNTYGGLIYINSRTGDKTEWAEFGDVQTLTMGDLRAMKGTQRAFYENQWIYIIDVADAGYEDVTSDDICRALMVSQYYQGAVDPDYYENIFDLSKAEIEDLISTMADGAKTNLIVAANTAIQNGSLDSIRTIKTLEDALHCELDKPE